MCVCQQITGFLSISAARIAAKLAIIFAYLLLVYCLLFSFSLSLLYHTISYKLLTDLEVFKAFLDFLVAACYFIRCRFCFLLFVMK